MADENKKSLLEDIHFNYIKIISTGVQDDLVVIRKIQYSFLGRGLGKPFFGYKE